MWVVNNTTTQHRACRNLDNAMQSLNDAEELELVLRKAAVANPTNSYMVDAHRKAFELVNEMRNDVDDWMDKVDPDTFEAWTSRQAS